MERSVTCLNGDGEELELRQEDSIVHVSSSMLAAHLGDSMCKDISLREWQSYLEEIREKKLKIYEGTISGGSG